MLYPKDVKNGEVYPVKFTTVKFLQKILVLKEIMNQAQESTFKWPRQVIYSQREQTISVPYKMFSQCVGFLFECPSLSFDLCWVVT